MPTGERRCRNAELARNGLEVSPRNSRSTAAVLRCRDILPPRPSAATPDSCGRSAAPGRAPMTFACCPWHTSRAEIVRLRGVPINRDAGDTASRSSGSSPPSSARSIPTSAAASGTARPRIAAASPAITSSSMPSLAPTRARAAAAKRKCSPGTAVPTIPTTSTSRRSASRSNAWRARRAVEDPNPPIHDRRADQLTLSFHQRTRRAMHRAAALRDPRNTACRHCRSSLQSSVGAQQVQQCESQRPGPFPEKFVRERRDNHRCRSLEEAFAPAGHAAGCHIILCLRKRLTLRTGNRHNGNIVKKLEDRDKLGEIEPPMQRRKERHLGTLQEGLPKIVEMEMNDVELFCTTRDRLQHRYMRSDMVMRRLI